MKLYAVLEDHALYLIIHENSNNYLKSHGRRQIFMN